MSMKPGARTRPWASRTRSPGVGEMFPTLAMRLLRMRSEPSRRGAPVPSASWALMIRTDWSPGGCAWKATGVAIANESENRRRRIMPRLVSTKKSFVFLGSMLLAAGSQRAQPKLAVLLALGAGSKMGPDRDENDGDYEDKRRDGIDFRGDAAAEAAPDLQRQSVFAAVEEKCDGDFVHGESEDQQSGSDQREL